MTAKPDDDYLWDGTGEDAEVARLEGLLSPLAHDPERVPLDELRLRRKRSRLPWMIAAGAVAAAAVALVLLWPKASGDGGTCFGPGMVFEGTGTVSCNGTPLAVGVLPIHGTLETGTSSAQLTIANIGTAKLSPNTVVRLDRTQIGKRHELFLEVGKMHAKVNAPPRIFAVTTSSADVVDLGCEYTLEIDKAGAGSIKVLTGQVELETGNGAVVLAPAGTRARLLPGRRASLPIVDTASPPLVAAVTDLEAGKPDALARVLAAASKADAISVANLGRMVVGEAQQRTVFEALAKLVAIPQCTTVDEVIADKDLWEMWFEEVYLVHIGASDGLPTRSCAP